MRAPEDGRHTILVVAMPNSVHTARWLNMVRAPDLRFVLLPVYEETLSASLAKSRVVRTLDDVAALDADEIGVFDTSVVPHHAVESTNVALAYETWRPPFFSAGVVFAQPLHLLEAIRLLRPALVHSMEIQMAGYLCLAARQHSPAQFPPWLLSNWGSDIYLYRKLPDHRARLATIAQSIDAYLAECRRDVAIVRQMGFRGAVLPPTPASGGMAFEDAPRLQDLAPPSQRSEILVKGYHNWAGRALHILAALQLVAPVLQGRRIRIALAGPAVREMAAELTSATGLDIVCDSYLDSHADALERISEARITIGLGVSDGISTTLLEAMAMGSFPIQANTSCGCEWVKNGETGFMVSPHDIASLADAIARAASDDALVDAAAIYNRSTAEARWDATRNGRAMIGQYRGLVAGSARTNAGVVRK